jgi:hypothetical protein
MAFECGICASMFNTGPRIPLILECGHTFCQSCVQHNLGGQRCCPYCRHPIQKHVDELPRWGWAWWGFWASHQLPVTAWLHVLRMPDPVSQRVRADPGVRAVQELRAGERHGGSKPAPRGAHGQVQAASMFRAMALCWQQGRHSSQLLGGPDVLCCPRCCASSLPLTSP